MHMATYTGRTGSQTDMKGVYTLNDIIQQREDRQPYIAWKNR